MYECRIIHELWREVHFLILEMFPRMDENIVLTPVNIVFYTIIIRNMWSISFV